MQPRRKRRTAEELKGLPSPDSPAFKNWLKRNIGNFSEMEFRVLASTYNRAKKAGDIK